MKLSVEDKINIYEKRKKGISCTQLSMEYNVQSRQINYLVRLIDYHGFSILRTHKNKYYSKEFKEQAIHRVLIHNEAAETVSIENGLTSNGLLFNWLRNYKENGYNVIERPKGRPSMTKKTKNTSQANKLTLEEQLKQAEKENEYLRAENEYLKKLDVVVRKRKRLEQQKK